MAKKFLTHRIRIGNDYGEFVIMGVIGLDPETMETKVLVEGNMARAVHLGLSAKQYEAFDSELSYYKREFRAFNMRYFDQLECTEDNNVSLSFDYCDIEYAECLDEALKIQSGKNVPR